MINHLSPQQISSLMIGQAKPDEAQHAAECSECAAEVLCLQETLAVFRDSVQQWTDRCGGSEVPSPAFLRTDSAVFSGRPFHWALAVVALILLVLIPVHKNTSERRLVEAEAEDTLLLEQVNAQLSRTVPEALEPLMTLLSDATPDETGGRQ
jgi:hypothetical protein